MVWAGGILFFGSFDHDVYALLTHLNGSRSASRRLSGHDDAVVEGDDSRRGGRRRNGRRHMARRRGEHLHAAPSDPPLAAVVSAAQGANLDPLGYYRFSWAPPTDACGTEMHADYDGVRAHTWGSKFRKRSAAECCAACDAHPRCHSWTYCPEPVCFAPDVWNHTFGECARPRATNPFLLSILSDPRASISHATLIPPPAPNPHFPTGWLKEQRDASRPAVNMRGEYTAKYRARHGHHHAPPRVAWVSGVPVSKLRGRPMTNGTWSGRAVW